MKNFILPLLMGCLLPLIIPQQTLYAQNPPIENAKPSRQKALDRVPQAQLEPEVLVRPVSKSSMVGSQETVQFKPYKIAGKKASQYTVDDWGHIIDSTWGPGAPLVTKLAIFDAYATALSNKFDGFLSLGLTWSSWDSLKNSFRSRITSTTSRGVFASIMAKFAMRLRDGHTWAWDTGVLYSPLLPGVPLLDLYTWEQADHFGAVLTSLPDSTALVLRTAPSHPLGLEPGDIVLGYEGVPWKQLVKQLLDADVPVVATGVGAASAEIHSIIRNAGNNWHLFDTIDILKHSTHDTLHLSVQPLVGLPTDPLTGNEQLEIPGIPMSFYRGWPWTPTGQPLNFGKLPSTNVGYIRLLGEWPSNAADPLFAAAVDSLWNADGLIIDMRYNSGGWSTFDQAFAKMFSERLYTTEDAQRANTTTFDLVPYGNAAEGLIPGVPGSIYDRPIAVLLGPTCMSLGDWTAQRLRYHPMTRFFGKSSIASIGYSQNVTGWEGWWLRHSISDAYHISQPGVYLNRREFPIDEEVWHNPDDVANGVDAVVKSAVDWITGLAYAHDVLVNKDTLSKLSDSITVTAKVENPGSHSLVVSAIVTSVTGTQVDSLLLVNDGLHGDGSPGDNIWGAFIKCPAGPGNHNISVRTEDNTAGNYRRLTTATQFTVLPNVIVGTNPPGLAINVDGTPLTGDQSFLWPSGSIHTITIISPLGGGASRFVFSNWSDGGAMSHTITAPESTTIYRATFILQWLLTTESLPPGSGNVDAVPASADGYYNNRTSVQLTAIPNPAYTFSAWSGYLNGSTNPQSVFMSVPRSVTASFSLIVKMIIATSGQHGTISPEDTVPVAFGGNQRFIITPESGYYVDSLLVDGVKIDSTEGYTFFNVTTDHTIRVVFRSPMVTVHWAVGHNWNMISCPVEAVNDSFSVLFPTSISKAFSYLPGFGYHSEQRMRDGAGYWLKFNAQQPVSMIGLAYDEDTVTVEAGWNLIGSISKPVAVAQIVSDSTGLTTSRFFGYAGTYLQTDTIWPGSAYWVKASRSGKLILSSELSPLSETVRIRIVSDSDLPPPPPDGETPNPNPPVADQIPRRFELAQNYPNPFNPTTEIRYAIPDAGLVTLKIYDMLGKEVATLVNEAQSAGYKSVTWDAANTPTGIYFYKLTAGSYSDTKKLILLK